MNKKTKIIILISACLLIVVIGIYFLFSKGNNNQNIYVQKVSTIIGSSYTENRYSGVVESSETVDINQDGNKSITDMYVKAGQKVTRKGWNGKGMFVVYQKGYPQGIPCNKQTAEAWGLNEGDLFVCNPYLQIRCVDGSHSMWVPSINDCLAEDWCSAQ